MSLKGGMSDRELLDAIDDARKGKKKALDKLSKYAESGLISAERYEELVGKECIERIKKYKKRRDKSQKIKSVLAVIILFVSMLCGLAYLIEQYGKGVAVLYIFLWVWSLSYALRN